VSTDAAGLPLVVTTTPANTRDDTMGESLLVAMPLIQESRGRPRTKPKALQGDGSYSEAATVKLVKELGIKPILAPLSRAHTHGTGLSKTRYVVERTLSWVGNYRWLRLCYKMSGSHFQDFHELKNVVSGGPRRAIRFGQADAGLPDTISLN
jgi:hypothetical protein